MDIESDFGWAASFLADKSVIGGYQDGSFRDWQTVNRAEAAKFLLRAKYGDFADIPNNNKFWDVRDGEWYVKYVMMASQKGIISGYEDGTFGPGRTVNTAEFLKMISLTFGLQQNLPTQYPDVSQQDWFYPYVGITEKFKMLPSRWEYLDAGRDMTRGEVAYAIAIVLENQKKGSSSSTSSASSTSSSIDTGSKCPQTYTCDLSCTGDKCYELAIDCFETGFDTIENACGPSNKGNCVRCKPAQQFME
jgi:hypothetical protein